MPTNSILEEQFEKQKVDQVHQENRRNGVVDVLKKTINEDWSFLFPFQKSRIGVVLISWFGKISVGNTDCLIDPSNTPLGVLQIIDKLKIVKSLVAIIPVMIVVGPYFVDIGHQYRQCTAPWRSHKLDQCSSRLIECCLAIQSAFFFELVVTLRT